MRLPMRPQELLLACKERDRAGEGGCEAQGRSEGGREGRRAGDAGFIWTFSLLFPPNVLACLDPPRATPPRGSYRLSRLHVCLAHSGPRIFLPNHQPPNHQPPTTIPQASPPAPSAGYPAPPPPSRGPTAPWTASASCPTWLPYGLPTCLSYFTARARVTAGSCGRWGGEASGGLRYSGFPAQTRDDGESRARYGPSFLLLRADPHAESRSTHYSPSRCGA